MLAAGLNLVLAAVLSLGGLGLSCPCQWACTAPPAATSQRPTRCTRAAKIDCCANCSAPVRWTREAPTPLPTPAAVAMGRAAGGERAVAATAVASAPTSAAPPGSPPALPLRI
jgi:hypothetical protein